MFEIDNVLSFDYFRRELAVTGWSCLDDRTPPDELWVECDGTRSPCLPGLPRPDVARVYNAPSLGSAGFLTRFPVTRDVTPISLIARHKGVEHRLGEFQAQWSPTVDRPASELHDYATWLRTHEARLYWPVSELKGHLRGLSSTPLISVILPTFNTHLYHLHRCIESVIAQCYPHWELCVSDDASPNPRVREYLLQRAAGEPRIRLSFSSERGGISAASNRSLAAATGDFIVLLDHDDELHQLALLELARCLNAHPDADVVYSDEDKIDQVGVRCHPAFKPEFDRDMLAAFNYIGHLVSMRTALVRQVGGFRSDSDGAQDWDLLLRVTSASTPDSIRHIPKPLYHWRMHGDSTAFSLDAKPYAIRAWNLVLERHIGSVASCEVRDGLFLGSMRIVRRLPAETRASVLYRACDGPHQRRALRRSRSQIRAKFYEVIFSGVHPAEAPHAGTLMTVDDLDSEVTVIVACGIDSVNHHFFEELVAQALRDDCGIVGGTVLGADGKILTAGLVCLSDGTYLNPFVGMALTEPGYMGQARVVRRVSSIGPHFFAVRTSRLLEINGLASISEDSLSETCSALVRSAHAQGLRVLHTPYAIATLRKTASIYEPRQGAPAPPELRLNPNLEAFSNVTAILRAGIH